MARHPYPARSSRTHPKQHKAVCELFGVKRDPRLPQLPRASEMGMTDKQRNVFRRIRRMQVDLVEELSIWDIKLAETRLAAIEELIQAHFPHDWARLNGLPEPAAPTSVATEARPLAS